MNQMDENYWKSLASAWIQSRSQQQQINEVNSHLSQLQQSIENNEAAADIAVVDMEIEDVKDEDEGNFWNYKNTNLHQQQQHPNHHHLQPQINTNFHQNDYERNFSKPIKAPEPPIISNIQNLNDGASLNLVDMDMDSDNEAGDDSNSNSASSGTMIEAHKKKLLPHWIREGLEKMKREKEQETARHEEELRLKEEEAQRKKMMEEALLEIEKEKASKSKYDSSSEEEENDDDGSANHKTDKVAPNTLHSSDSKLNENEDEDEDIYEKMMLLVRKTLTSILLEVTNEKILEISKETLSKYRKKASATQSKPAIVGLGLGVYSSSSDEESGDDEKNKSDQSDWEPESVLKERIRQKTIAFEKRSRDVKDKLAKISELEEIKYRKKKESDDYQQHKKSNAHKDHGGEEKYETKIYSISSSSAATISNSRSREKKTRFSDPKEARANANLTHVSVLNRDNGNSSTTSTSSVVVPLAPNIHEPSLNKEKSKKKRRSSSSSNSTSSSQHHRKKHKKHKKSSKKKANKKRDRSSSRERHHHKSDRRSIESKSSESHSKRSRSRSRSRDRHHRRRY